MLASPYSCNTFSAVAVHALAADTAACLAAASHLHEASHHHKDLQQSIKAVSQDSAPADGALTLPGITSALLKQQFMFAVAVHEDAKQLAQQLQQMRQAKQNLLQAARKGAVPAFIYFWYWYMHVSFCSDSTCDCSARCNDVGIPLCW